MLNHIIAEGRLCPAVRHDANTPPRAVGETPYVSAWDVTLQAGSRDSAADLDRWGVGSADEHRDRVARDPGGAPFLLPVPAASPLLTAPCPAGPPHMGRPAGHGAVRSGA